eukprot:TRINITY_DN65009_c0_g1_i1.p1 TRINITY_DN65009_c0_g1~~TRINITY_DN65009_c0_g1_i1.p1  ORF type:complete len:327 (+),score=77.65 TRINITY_DN65009_c0_g1_i1:145-1125(+)
MASKIAERRDSSLSAFADWAASALMSQLDPGVATKKEPPEAVASDEATTTTTAGSDEGAQPPPDRPPSGADPAAAAVWRQASHGSSAATTGQRGGASAFVSGLVLAESDSFVAAESANVPTVAERFAADKRIAAPAASSLRSCPNRIPPESTRSGAPAKDCADAPLMDDPLDEDPLDPFYSGSTPAPGNSLPLRGKEMAELPHPGQAGAAPGKAGGGSSSSSRPSRFGCGGESMKALSCANCVGKALHGVPAEEIVLDWSHSTPEGRGLIGLDETGIEFVWAEATYRRQVFGGGTNGGNAIVTPMPLDAQPEEADPQYPRSSYLAL